MATAKPTYRALHTPSQALPTLIIVIGVLVLASWAATQYIAAQYQYAFPDPVAHWGHMRIYKPVAWIGWAVQIQRANSALPLPFYHGLFILLGALPLAVWLAARRNRRSARRQAQTGKALHGTAAWATVNDIANAQLLPQRGGGVYVGAIKHQDGLRYLRSVGPENVEVIAPPRSGKGVSLIIPTLLNWQESTFVFDIKGENWALSAGYRQKINQTTMKLEPAAFDADQTIRYNPLAEIRAGSPYEVADAQAVAEILVYATGEEKEDHWTRSAQGLLTGLILYVLYDKEQDRLGHYLIADYPAGPPPVIWEPAARATLADLLQVLTDPATPIQKTFEALLAGSALLDSLTEAYKDIDDFPTPAGRTLLGIDAHYGNGGQEPLTQHPVIASMAREMLDKADRERASIISTAQQKLQLWHDPIVARNTRGHDLTITDMMFGETPVSLYLVIQPKDLQRLAVVARIFITQMIRLLTARDVHQTAPHKLLLMLDEFPALGKLPILAKGLAFLPGYGIRAYVIVQDFSQLRSVYGKEEAITSASHIRIAFAPNRFETADELAKMTGETTELHTRINYTKQPGLFGKTSRSHSVQETKRLLMTPGEVMNLRQARKNENGEIIQRGEMLIFVAGAPPIRGEQPLFFQDKALVARAALAPPAGSLTTTVTDAEPASATEVTAPDAEPGPNAEAAPSAC